MTLRLTAFCLCWHRIRRWSQSPLGGVAERTRSIFKNIGGGGGGRERERDKFLYILWRSFMQALVFEREDLVFDPFEDGQPVQRPQDWDNVLS